MRDASTGLVLVAAGSSRRMGGTDKVWTEIAGKPLLWYSLHSLYPLVDSCVLVVRSDRLLQAEALGKEFPALRVVSGGQQRHESVARGIEALPDVSIIAVHDAARPLAPPALLETGIALAAIHGSAIPVVPLADTIKRVDENGQILGTVDRDSLRGAQTPQVFRADDLRRAHQQSHHTGTITDDASLFEVEGSAGAYNFPGAPSNFKVTTEFDLLVARTLIEGGWYAP